MTEKPRNMAASVHARLLNLAKERGDDFNLLLQRYAAERFLCRLSSSPYAERFVLKGAMLYAVWGGEAYRATRDLDLLGLGADVGASVADRFRQVCAVAVPEDGLRFLPDSLTSEEIRDAAEYHGVRVRLEARLGRARIRLQVDVGIGDAIVPSAERVEYPTLLGGPGPRVLAYPREAVVAEKLHAMVVLGEANSRLRDFYDLFVFARRFEFDGQRLASAISATFARRRTQLPSPSSSPVVALSPRFFDDAGRAVQWRAFLDRHGLDSAPPDFAVVGESLAQFVAPVLAALSERRTLDSTWAMGGPWL